jgi:hypothetical protein
MVSPAILGAQPWFHGLWPGRHVGLKLSRLPSEQFPSYQKLTRREPRRLPSCDIALHLERADVLVTGTYDSEYLTSSDTLSWFRSPLVSKQDVRQEDGNEQNALVPSFAVHKSIGCLLGNPLSSGVLDDIARFRLSVPSGLGRATANSNSL